MSTVIVAALLLPVMYYVFIRGRLEILLAALIVAFAISNLPSAFKEYFAISVGGAYIMPQDWLLLMILAGMFLVPQARRRAEEDRVLLLLVCCYLAMHAAALVLASATEAFELNFVRQSFIGALWTACLLFNFMPNPGPRAVRAVAVALFVHNVLMLIGGYAVLTNPQVNDFASPLASMLGFAADEAEGASLVLVSPLAGSIAVISVWFYLFVCRRGLASPFVLTGILTAICTSHRIDYMAMAMVLIAYAWRLVKQPPGWGRGLAASASMLVYGAAAVALLRLSGLELGSDIIAPFQDRALSLIEGSQSGTVTDRVEQYSYFFRDYLQAHEPARYAFGEAYLPADLRDQQYQYAQPHNFMLYGLVNVGVVGMVLLTLIVGHVLVARGGFRSQAFWALALLMATQLTDAGFTNFPISAYFGVILAMCCVPPVRAVIKVVGAMELRGLQS